MSINQSMPILSKSVLNTVIVRNPLQVPPDTSVRDAITQMAKVMPENYVKTPTPHELEHLHHIVRSSCVFVVEGEMPVGILTERDLVHLIARKNNLDLMLMQQVMTPSMIWIHESKFPDLPAALQLLQKHELQYLPVLNENNRLVGVVTRETIQNAIHPLNRQITSTERDSSILEYPDAIPQNNQIDTDVFELLPFGISRYDVSGHCIYVNTAFCAMTGLTSELSLGKGWQRVLHPEDRQQFTTLWESVNHSNHSFQQEYRIQLSDGTVKWVEKQVILERNALGEVSGFLGTMVDISARKQAQSELLLVNHERLELKFLEKILEVVLGGYWDWDIPNNEEYLSPNFKRMFGYEDHELPNTPEAWQQLVFPEDLPRIFEDANKHFQSHGEIPFYNEVRYRHKNGSTVWVICSGQVIEWDTDGNPLRMIGCHIDISKLRIAEETQKLQLAAMEAASEGIAILKDATFLYMNQAHLKEFGYEKKEELIGETWEILYSQDELDRLRKDVFPVLIKECAWRGECTATRKDGSSFVEDLSLTLTENDLLICVCRDISDRKHAEHQSQEISRRLALATSSAHIGIWDFDLIQNTLIWDDQMYSLYGVQPQDSENVYETWQRCVHPDDLPKAVAKLQAARAGKQDFETDFRVVWPNGKVRFIQAHAVVLRDEQMGAHRIIGVNWDITNRKRTEEKIQQYADQLQASNRELEAFAYSVSHDLRSPLRAIDGFSNALMQDYGKQLQGDAKLFLQYIRENVHRMEQFIDGLLNLSTVSRTDIEYTSVNLSQLAQELLSELQVIEPERHIKLCIEPNIVVSADRLLMRVVLENLLKNAWKFTQNCPLAHITFGVMTSDRQPTYYVRDNGAGFNMDYAHKLFGVFQRLHQTHEFPGTGIGLASVQRAIHRHGGRVWAEGAIDLGATFYFTVPHYSASE